MGQTTSLSVAVKSRMFVNLFNEQFGFLVLPFLKRLDWGLVVQRALRYVVVVEGQVTLQGGFKFRRGCKSRLLDQLRDSSIKI